MVKIFKPLAPFLRRAALAILTCLAGMPAASLFAVEPEVVVTVEQRGRLFIVDAAMTVPVSLDIAWGVLTDFDHMTTILGNLTASRVTSRDGNLMLVRQQGVARYGVLSYAFESEREIRLEPKKRILAKNIGGTLLGTESQAILTPFAAGVRIAYHADIVPDTLLLKVFGAPFLRREMEEQFLCAAREMARRSAETVFSGAVERYCAD